MEMQDLQTNQLRRKQAVEIYKQFIDDSVKGKQKGIRYRKSLRSFLLVGADTLFSTEEEEYTYINKFGRGCWNIYDIKKNFNFNDQKIVEAIARSYGAFDY